MNKVSIIIAVFNGVDTIDKCICSSVGQTYNNKEIIVIDGGSTDGTKEIIIKHGSNIDYWESKKDNGIYSAWNKALAHSSGDWICFIGADDYWAYPQALSDLIQEGKDQATELVSGRVAIIDKDHDIKRYYGKPWNWHEIKRHHCIAHPGMIHHRSCYERIGLYNEKYKIAGDYDFSLRLGQSTKAKFIDKIIVHMGDNGVSHRRINKTLREVLMIQSKNKEIGKKQAIANYLVSNIVIFSKIILGKL